MHTPKTDRKRGVIYSTIRRIARRRRRFKLHDLVPPLSNFKQAQNNLQRLIEAGEIVRVQSASRYHGKPAILIGDWILRAVYQKTELLRPPELTNRHLK